MELADGDFEHAAAEAAGAGVFGQGRAGRVLPGGGEIGIGLDAAVAAGGDQLGQHIADFFGLAGVVPPLLAIAAGVEVGGGVVGGLHGCEMLGAVCSGHRCAPARALSRERLTVAGQGHDDVAVAVVGGADGGCVAVLQVDRECFFGFQALSGNR